MCCCTVTVQCSEQPRKLGWQGEERGVGFNANPCNSKVKFSLYSNLQFAFYLNTPKQENLKILSATTTNPGDAVPAQLGVSQWPPCSAGCPLHPL